MNIRWATPEEQGQNKRTNNLVTFNNRTQCIAAWAREIGIGSGPLAWRLTRWSIERALTTPLRRQRP